MNNKIKKILKLFIIFLFINIIVLLVASALTSCNQSYCYFFDAPFLEIILFIFLPPIIFYLVVPAIISAIVYNINIKNNSLRILRTALTTLFYIFIFGMYLMAFSLGQS